MLMKKTKLKLTIDIILNRARANLGLTADRQLADWLGVTRSIVSAWRRHGGRHMPRPKTIEKLALAAQVTPEDVMNAVYAQKIKNLMEKMAP